MWCLINHGIEPTRVGATLFTQPAARLLIDTIQAINQSILVVAVHRTNERQIDTALPNELYRAEKNPEKV